MESEIVNFPFGDKNLRAIRHMDGHWQLFDITSEDNTIHLVNIRIPHWLEADHVQSYVTNVWAEYL